MLVGSSVACGEVSRSTLLVNFFGISVLAVYFVAGSYPVEDIIVSTVVGDSVSKGDFMVANGGSILTAANSKTVCDGIIRISVESSEAGEC